LPDVDLENLVAVDMQAAKGRYFTYVAMHVSVPHMAKYLCERKTAFLVFTLTRRTGRASSVSATRWPSS
jgi:hypothetical protein